MNQIKLLEASRRLVKLNDDPQPGLATWHIACQRAADDIRAAVNEQKENPLADYVPTQV